MIQAQGYRADQAGVTLTPFALILAGLSPWAGGLVDRYGPRLPLIIGPSITGASFLLLSLVGLTNGWVDYWTTYFPGIVLFGLGMAITVAPLTTTVMGSVATHHAGIASGINNAVARTAGLLAVAILGGLALFTFGDALDARAASIDLSPETRIELRAEAANLGQASVPQSVAADQVDAVDTAIRLAFIDTTKSVLLVCAGMAWLSAIMAAVLIKPKIEVME